MPTDADWAPESVRSTDMGIGQGLAGPLRENNPFTALKLRVDQDLSDSVKLVSLSSYNEFEREALFDWSGAPYEILVQKATGKIESLAEDLHIEGETENLNWLVGAYYAKDKILDSNRTLLGQNANVTLIRTVGLPCWRRRSIAVATPRRICRGHFRTYEDIGHIDTETWSVFTNAGLRLNEQFKLNAGVRYTEDRSGLSRLLSRLQRQHAAERERGESGVVSTELRHPDGADRREPMPYLRSRSRARSTRSRPRSMRAMCPGAHRSTSPRRTPR